MKGRLGKFGNTTNPLIVVEWIIAIQTLVGGVYLLSPVLKIAQLVSIKSPLVAAVASKPGIIILAAVSILAALIIIAGICKRKVKWRTAGLFIVSLVRLYALLAGIIANGFLPLTWLSSLTVLLITSYIWLRIRMRGME